MAVYTPLDQEDMTSFIQQFNHNRLLSYSGIQGGVENTNYRLSTSQGDYVLTLFEHHSAAEVEDFVRLATFLQRQGIRVPAPLTDSDGNWLHIIKDRPAILCPLLPGHHPQQISANHCWQIGHKLASIHQLSGELDNPRKNDKGFNWWQSAYTSLSANLNSSSYSLMSKEMAWQLNHRDVWRSLPGGWIHGDLFRDNTLFSAAEPGKPEQLSAILDWYNACEGVWIYDLAIVANDWCCDEYGEWDNACYEALLSGYQQVRPFTSLERYHWPLVLRGAALRFWLSRLDTLQHQQQSGSDGIRKDPDEYRRKLVARQKALSPELTVNY